MSEVNLKIGDVVVLKSVFEEVRGTSFKSYPLMTINSINNDDKTIFCKWFNKSTNEFKTDKFDKDTIKKI